VRRRGDPWPTAGLAAAREGARRWDVWVRMDVVSPPSSPDDAEFGTSPRRRENGGPLQDAAAGADKGPSAVGLIGHRNETFLDVLEKNDDQTFLLIMVLASETSRCHITNWSR
jgi:hypothetical protein